MSVSGRPGSCAMRLPSRRPWQERSPAAPPLIPASKFAASSRAPQNACRPADALPIVRALLARGVDEHDIHIPLLLWWALEAKVATDPELVLEMFSESESWNLPIVKSVITERLMRRFAAAGTRQDLGYLCPASGPGTRPGSRQTFDGRFRVSLRRAAPRRLTGGTHRCPGEI